MLDKLQNMTMLKKDKRFYGVEAQKLQKIRTGKSYSMREEIRDMQNISELLLKDEFNFNVVPASTFMQELIPISQHKIDKNLSTKTINIEHNLLPAFRNFLLRDYFPIMLDRYSFEVVRLLKKDPDHTYEFINFFDGTSLYSHGQRWIKPKLTLDNIGLTNPKEVELYFQEVIKKDEAMSEMLYMFFKKFDILHEWHTYIGGRGRFTRLFMVISERNISVNEPLSKKITIAYRQFLELEKARNEVQRSIKKAMAEKLKPLS